MTAARDRVDKARKTSLISFEAQLMTAVLLVDETPDHEALRRLSVPLEFKRPILVALGQRFPKERERYFALARKLNYAPVFPRHLLREVLASK